MKLILISLVFGIAACKLNSSSSNMSNSQSAASPATPTASAPAPDSTQAQVTSPLLLAGEEDLPTMTPLLTVNSDEQTLQITNPGQTVIMVPVDNLNNVPEEFQPYTYENNGKNAVIFQVPSALLSVSEIPASTQAEALDLAFTVPRGLQNFFGGLQEVGSKGLAFFGINTKGMEQLTKDNFYKQATFPKQGASRLSPGIPRAPAVPRALRSTSQGLEALAKQSPLDDNFRVTSYIQNKSRSFPATGAKATLGKKYNQYGTLLGMPK